jgi:hypothetical protein
VSSYSSWLVALAGLSLAACSDTGREATDSELVGVQRQALATATGASGFVDDHDNGTLRGWVSVGARRWVEASGAIKTSSPGYAAKVGESRAGFLISEYPSADDGTFETTITADAWNGNAGGVVFRWSSPSHFYYVTVKPGNQWTSQLVFHVNTLDPSQGRVIAQNFQLGTTFKLKVVATGGTFGIYLDDVLMQTVRDSTNPSGRVGYAYADAWENLFSAERSQWVDQAGSTPGQAVDPRAGRVELKVHARDEAFTDNVWLKPRLYVENTGEVTVGDFNAYYLFTAEAGKTPVLEDWWTPESTPTLVSLGGNQYAIEYHFTGLNLAPGEITPSLDGNLVGIHYTDWSPLDKSNDFSNPAGPGMQETSTIPVEGTFKPSTDFTAGGEPVVRPVGGSLPATTVKMKRLHLDRLRCVDTTDDSDFWGGEDHVAVHVTLDGQSAKTINAGGMDETGDQDDDDPKNYYFDGNGGTDNDHLELTSSARISVYDYEGLSFEVFRVQLFQSNTSDFIGAEDLDLTPGQHYARFNRDGKYDFWYTIEEFEESRTFATLAEYQLEKFRESTEPGVWANVDKTQLIEQMGERLRPRTLRDGVTVWPGASLVSQGGIGFCGPAAATYWLINNRPLRYVLFARDMFEKGKYMSSGGSYSASAELRGCAVPASKMARKERNKDGGLLYDSSGALIKVESAAADWLVMSTLFDVFKDGDDHISCAAGGQPEIHKDTRTAEMLKWFRDILGYPYVNDEHTLIFGEAGLLENANRVVSKGGAAVLGVDNAVLKSEPDDDWGLLPDHYIAFLGELKVNHGEWYDWNTGHFKFKFFDHANITTLELNEARLEDSVFGGTLSE